jgi:maleate cis-trans isomerase
MPETLAPTEDAAMNTMSRGTARIGVPVLFTNTNFEADMALLRPAGISFHNARLGGYERDEIPDEAQIAGLGASDLEEPLALLVGVRPDVVLYG